MTQEEVIALFPAIGSDSAFGRVIAIDTVDADRQTGEWITTPVHRFNVGIDAWHHAMRTNNEHEDRHLDTYEEPIHGECGELTALTETRGVIIHWRD